VPFITVFIADTIPAEKEKSYSSLLSIKSDAKVAEGHGEPDGFKPMKTQGASDGCPPKACEGGLGRIGAGPDRGWPCAATAGTTAGDGEVVWKRPHEWRPAGFKPQRPNG